MTTRIAKPDAQTLGAEIHVGDYLRVSKPLLTSASRYLDARQQIDVDGYRVGDLLLVTMIDEAEALVTLVPSAHADDAEPWAYAVTICASELHADGIVKG